jgi:hypothetical protein
VPRRAGVHPQQAPAKIDNAPGGVSEELLFDLVKKAAASGDDADVAQNDEIFAIQFRAASAKVRPQ